MTNSEILKKYAVGGDNPGPGGDSIIAVISNDINKAMDAAREDEAINSLRGYAVGGLNWLVRYPDDKTVIAVFGLESTANEWKNKYCYTCEVVNIVSIKTFLSVLEENYEAAKRLTDEDKTRTGQELILETYEDLIAIYKSNYLK